MVVLLAKFFYAAMLAGVVAGQTIAIIAPANGDALQAGTALTVELMRSVRVPFPSSLKGFP